MLALVIYAYANGVFSSRRIERATHRDIGMRFVAANLHPDHNTIATFRRGNRAAIEAAFLHVPELACEMGLMRLGTPDRQINLTDPDSKLMRRSDAHEYRPVDPGAWDRRYHGGREMKARLQQAPEKALYALRKQTVEPVFGIIKNAMGFTRFHLRGLANVATEWTVVTLAYNCRGITR